jgi:hypothetical protein
MNKNWLVLAAVAFLWTASLPPAQAFHVGLGNAVAFQGAKVVDKAANPLPSCGGQMALFTQLPITDSNLINLAPMGSQEGHVLPPDHMYFNFPTFVTGEVTHAPGNGWITQIVEATYPSTSAAPGGINPIYYFTFQPCAEVSLITGLGALSPALSAALTSGYTSCSSFGQNLGGANGSCVTNLQLPVHAGDALTIGVVPDFGALSDTRFTISGFANPSRHNLNRGFCPLNYFAPGVLPPSYATGYIAGSTPIPRTASPLCGTIVQDIPGTAQGDWYFPGSDTTPGQLQEEYQMALVHDAVYTSSEVFSVGNSNTLPAVFQEKNFFQPKMVADGTRIEYDFGLVNDNQIYCYDTFGGLYPNFMFTNNLSGYIALIQLTDPAKDTLQIDVQNPGGSANCTTTAGTWAFTPAAVIFQR